MRMLILLLRALFVLGLILVGHIHGQYFYQMFAPGLLPDWFGAAMGFGVAATLLAAEQAAGRRFARHLIAILIGLAGGLGLSALILLNLDLIIQNPDLRNNLDVPLSVITVYLVLITVLRNADRWRVVVPFVEFRPQQIEEGALVLDASALRDGRLRGLLDTWLLDHRLILHRRVLIAVEAWAGDSDPASTARGHRALEAIEELRQRFGSQLEVSTAELPQAEHLSECLIGLARLENACLLTSDADLATRARTERIKVLDLSELAARMVPTIRPGERIRVAIEKTGETPDQGIGHLDDGSLVVVKNAGQRVGEPITATVVRLHQTSSGRMVFAHLEDAPRKS